MKKRPRPSASNCARCNACGATPGSGCSNTWSQEMPVEAQDDDLVMNLVEMALARPREERDNYLRSVCAGDTELLTRAQSYVHWEERMNGFLLDPLYPLISDDGPAAD